MLEPLGHRVLLEQTKIEEVDPAYKAAKEMGFQLPEKETSREQAAIDKGVVVAVGATCWRDFGDGTPWANVGDTVYFARYAGKPVTDPVTNKKYVLLNDEDLVAKVIE